VHNHILEPAAREFADATAQPPFLYELGTDGARKVLDDVQAAPIATPDVDDTWISGPAQVGYVAVRIVKPFGATGRLPAVQAQSNDRSDVRVMTFIVNLMSSPDEPPDADVNITSAPIADPVTGRVLGEVTVVLPSESRSSAIRLVAQQAGRDVGHKLVAEGAKDRAALGWESLTASERLLAELVADGMTNKQAAARLYVSHHTVDSHLRHIFRKLGIRSRVELARLVTMQRMEQRDVA
jgi:DNA-binding CsgD family transcriptional regulator